MTHAIISNVEVMTKFVTTTVVLALPDDTQQVCNYVKRAVIKAIWKNKCFIYYGNLLIFSDNLNYISKGMCIYIYIVGPLFTLIRAAILNFSGVT